MLRFQNSATAGNANVLILAANAGTVFFDGSSTGGAAALEVRSNGTVDISGLTTPGMTAGLIGDIGDVGSDFYRLGSKTLTVGGSNLNATVRAVIADGGAAGGVGGSIIKAGTGTLTFAGGAANTYTGTTFVNEGTLALNKHFQVDAIRGPLVIGDGLGAANSARVSLNFSNQIFDAAEVLIQRDGRLVVVFNEEVGGGLTVRGGNVTVDTGANFTVNSFLDMTGGTIAGDGTVNLFGSATASSDAGGLAATISSNLRLRSATRTFTVNDGPGAIDLHINGVISNGGLTKAGAGTLVLAGANTYTGPTTVDAGTLLVPGSISNSVTTVNSGGTLGGTGKTGPLTLGGGTVAPGSENQSARLSTGNLALNSGTLRLNLNSAVQGTGYDQLEVTGNLIEYGMGTNPKAPSTLPPSGFRSERLTLSFTRNTEATDVTIFVEGSDTPGDPLTVLAQSRQWSPDAAPCARRPGQ